MLVNAIPARGCIRPPLDWPTGVSFWDSDKKVPRGFLAWRNRGAYADVCTSSLGTGKGLTVSPGNVNNFFLLKAEGRPEGQAMLQENQKKENPRFPEKFGDYEGKQGHRTAYSAVV